MGSIWCVPPESVTLELTWTDRAGGVHPFWIKVKRRLTVGESRHVITAGWKGVSNVGRRGSEPGDPEIKIDWKAQSFARALMYLQDWSLEDDTHKRLTVSADTLETLHPDVFELIENAITQHVEEMEQEKKVTSGDSELRATSA